MENEENNRGRVIIKHREKRTNHLFVIGIDEYKSRQLYNAVKDAKKLVEILTTYYEFDAPNVHTLYNEDATKENIIKKFKDLERKVRQEDNLIVYFAGHGDMQKNKKGYWIPTDAISNHGETNEIMVIENVLVQSYLEDINAFHTLLIADACFAGTLVSRGNNTTNRHIETADKHKSRIVFASGGLQEVSDGAIGEHSPFAKNLLTTLVNKATAPFTSLELIVEVTKGAVQKLNQDPVYGFLPIGEIGQNGDFVFYPKDNEEIAWQDAQQEHTIPAYENFVRKYPQSQYNIQAERNIILLNEALDEQAYRKAEKPNTSAAYTEYLQTYPYGKYANQAKEKRKALDLADTRKKADKAFEKAKKINTITEWEDFIDTYDKFEDLRSKAEEAKNLLSNPKTPDKLIEHQTFEKSGTPISFGEGQRWGENKDKAKAEYTELFQEFYKDKVITPIERKQLRKTQNELGLTEQEVKEIEDSIITPKTSQGFQNIIRLTKDFRRQLTAVSLTTLLLLIIVLNWESIRRTFAPQENANDTTSTAGTKLPETVVQQADTINKDNTDAEKAKQRQAELEIAKQEEQTAYKALKNDKKSLTAFLQKYPKSTYKADVQKRLDLLKDLPFTEPKMVYVEGGTYDMGYKEGRDGDNDNYMSNATLHEVTLSSFQMGAYEVSNQEFATFLNEKGNQTEGGVAWIDLAGSYGNEKCRISKSGATFKVQQGYENYPVIYVSWFGARAYCNWLAGKTGKKYRLPTEAEWEYATRQKGESVMFGNGTDIADPSQMNFYSLETAKKSYSVAGNYRGKTVPVNSFSPNSLGLYNMSGNVWEWCEDWYASDFYEKTRGAKNPVNKNSGTARVRRGGSWGNDPGFCRVAVRLGNPPSLSGHYLGFRLVISL